MITDRTNARDVTSEDILELIKAKVPEESALEYKETTDSDLLKAACGIANFGGGFILVGIQEDEMRRAAAVKDIPNSKGVADGIRQTLRDGISPRPAFEVVVLSIEGANMIVIRIAPQNPPHMISKDKRTDFYGRYDATSERMRYEEIEEKFREKHSAGELLPIQTPQATIESTIGRTGVSPGAKGFLDENIAKIVSTGDPTFALLAASDGITGSVSQDDALSILKGPLYDRKAGWLVAQPQLPVDFRSGIWEQRYGPYSLTTLDPSGDLVFVKPVDDVLCWTQSEQEFLFARRIYPNTLIEYCLSFAYALADIIAVSKPEKLLVVPLICSGNAKILLPLGEGGTIWFSSQIAHAKQILMQENIGLTIAEAVTVGRPLLSRELAFNLAKQIYSFFGYNPKDVPFSYHNEVTFEADAQTATLTSIRTYLRDTLLVSIDGPHEDFDRSSFMLALHLADGRRVFWVSEEFLYTHHWEEARLFGLLDSLGLTDKLLASSRQDKLLLSTDGVGPLPS